MKTADTAEERAQKIRAFVNKAKYQDFKEIPLSKIGFDIQQIDYSDFRRNYSSLVNHEKMKDEAKKLQAIER